MSDPYDYASPTGATGSAKGKRAYVYSASWEYIREYVTDAISRGISHRGIIAELDEQGVRVDGVKLDIHRLKRRLREWGLSGRNILRKHKKYIYEKEKEARANGWTIVRWYFGGTTMEVKRTLIEDIMGSDGTEYEDIEAEPGPLVYEILPSGEYVQENSSQHPQLHHPAPPYPFGAMHEPSVDPRYYNSGYGNAEYNKYFDLEGNIIEWDAGHPSHGGSFFPGYEDERGDACAPEFVAPGMMFHQQSQDNIPSSSFFQSDGHQDMMHDMAPGTGGGNPNFESDFFGHDPYARRGRARRPNN
ncbi:hypothetical protein TWF694_003704 [Orbilia ellipsospora]|uniref:Clr5 domain-containing protein n=1 Tax=Orbilia ellipsospora TaxID=2528407 RepID=A0AAV9WZ12_9PEZI